MKNETQKEKLVKLNKHQIDRFLRGDLVYVENSDKVWCPIDNNTIYVGIIEDL